MHSGALEISSDKETAGVNKLKGLAEKVSEEKIAEICERLELQSPGTQVQPSS
jgi:hypothetical protein